MGAGPTDNAAPEEPYVTSFTSTVRSVEDRHVTLERTYFYAEGGGQPADRGTIGGRDVVDVQKRDGETVHTLATEPAFEAGETVSGEIDETFRTYCMRAHTASHVVYGAGRKLFDEHGYGGFDIGEDRIRLDFETESDEVNPLTIQRMANEAVWESRHVEWYEMDADEAAADDEIVFNLGEDVGSAGTVRIVEIDGWDVSACGGTHVRNTREIGPIEVLSVSNPGAGLVRVEYAVGPTAIQHAIDERRNAARAADVLDTSVTELPQRAESVLAENAALKDENERLGERLLDARLAGLAENTDVKNGSEWLVGTVDAVGPNTVADRVADLDDAADVVALVGSDGSTFIVVGTDGTTDANDVIGDVTDEFGGGGGGQPTLAQGGGIGADPETVVEYLREE